MDLAKRRLTKSAIRSRHRNMGSPRSGNPNGRPKKPKTIHTFLDKALKETVVITKFEALPNSL